MAFAWLLGMSVLADPVTEFFHYQSSITSDDDGPLDLVAEIHYDDARTNAAIAVVMHGYSGTTGLLRSIRGNAQHLRDKGFFAISVAMRERDGSDGTRDSGGLEIYDIHDAVEAVKADHPTLINSAIVYLTGYSGGGGNTMSALTKFPDYFNAGAAFFGMSDYGYNKTDGWYFDGANASHQTQLRTDIGDPTTGDASVTNRYHARASNLASANNPYSEIHLFVNNNEHTCPPVNDTSYYSNAQSHEAFPGEFTNITVHIGATGLYEDFNHDGTNDTNELQSWPHGYPSPNQQEAAESWFVDRLLTGQIPRRALNDTDSIFVAGFVRTSRFECRVGDGQEGMIRLDYDFSPTNLIFQITDLSVETQLTSTLLVDTQVFTNRNVDVLLNSLLIESFMGGSQWSTNGLSHGDHLELRASSAPETIIQIESLTFSGSTNLNIIYGATNLTAQPDPWYSTNLLDGNWYLVPAPTTVTNSDGTYTVSFMIDQVDDATAFYYRLRIQDDAAGASHQ